MESAMMIVTVAFLVSTISLAGSNWLMNKPQPLTLKLVLPYTLVLFYGFLCATNPEHRTPLGFLTAGMVFAALGDTLLGTNLERYLAQGIRSFSICYLLFMVGFLLFPPVMSMNAPLSRSIDIASIVGGLFLFICLIYAIRKGQNPRPESIKNALMIYSVILVCFVVTAVKIPFSAGGAVLMMLCDTIIVRYLFVGPNQNLETESLFPYNTGHWLVALIVATSL